MDLNKFTLNSNASLIEVLKRIELLPFIQTVFIVDNNQIVTGTITDGDIRRGLINGLKLDSPIKDFMFRNFSFLIEGDDNFKKLKDFRSKRLKAVPLLSEEGHLVKIYDFTKTKSILPIDAVIMAGGKGERLKPLTNNTPKPLLKVGNKEIISYNFDRLYQFGITNQYVTVNHLAEQIELFCENYNEEINFSIVREEKFMGTAGSLSLIENFENDVLLLMNSDLLTNIDYEDFYKSFINSDADIMVASIPYINNIPYAIFNTQDNVVKSFKEKPSYTYYANAGIYILKRELLELIPKNKFYDATDLMEKVISVNKKLLHFPVLQYWLDIGKHEDFEKAQKDINNIHF